MLIYDYYCHSYYEYSKRCLAALDQKECTSKQRRKEGKNRHKHELYK